MWKGVDEREDSVSDSRIPVAVDRVGIGGGGVAAAAAISVKETRFVPIERFQKNGWKKIMQWFTKLPF